MLVVLYCMSRQLVGPVDACFRAQAVGWTWQKLASDTQNPMSSSRNFAHIDVTKPLLEQNEKIGDGSASSISRKRFLLFVSTNGFISGEDRWPA